MCLDLLSYNVNLTLKSAIEGVVDSHQPQLLSFSRLEAAICKLSGPIKANGWSWFFPPGESTVHQKPEGNFIGLMSNCLLGCNKREPVDAQLELSLITFNSPVGK